MERICDFSGNAKHKKTHTLYGVIVFFKFFYPISFGKVRFISEIPNRPSTSWSIKNDRNVTKRPMIAATIVPLAISTLPLSPPERIHLIPPQIRKKRAISAATMNRNKTALLITLPKFVEFIVQRLLKGFPIPPGAHGLTFV
jgi:hypothetical protein